jgi:hypothetical protein
MDGVDGAAGGGAEGIGSEKDGSGWGGEKDAGGSFAEALGSAESSFGDKPEAAPDAGWQSDGGGPKDPGAPTPEAGPAGDGPSTGYGPSISDGWTEPETGRPTNTTGGPTNTAGGGWGGAGWFESAPPTPDTPGKAADPPGWADSEGLSAEAWGALTALLGWSPPDEEQEEAPAGNHAALMDAVIRPWPEAADENLVLTGGRAGRAGPPMSGPRLLEYQQLRRENQQVIDRIQRLAPNWREGLVLVEPAPTLNGLVQREIARGFALRRELERAEVAAGLPPRPGIGHNRPPPETTITVPGAPPAPAPVRPLFGPGGIIDRPASPAEIGFMGEFHARQHLEAQGYTDITLIRNHSGQGVDIFARSPDGQRVAFEVKGTTGDRVSALSRDQQRPLDFVRSRLVRARDEIGAWGSSPPGTAERAHELLEALRNGEQFVTRRLDVYLNPDLSLRERVREREWRNVE